MRKLPFLLLVGLVFSVMPGQAQSAFRLYDDEGEDHLVTKVSDYSFFYGTDSENDVPISESRTRFRPTEHYVPGFIRIDSHKATHWSRSSISGAASHSYWLEIKLEVVPSREFEDVVLIFEWNHSELGRKILACPVGTLYADRPRKLLYELSLQEGYVEFTYKLAFLSGGVEVFSANSEVKMQTPLEEYRAVAEAELPATAPPRPLFVKAPRIREIAQKLAAENIETIVKVRATISAEGYVIATEVVDSPHPILSEDAVEAMRLWRFAPRFEDGVAVETEVIVPFRF